MATAQDIAIIQQGLSDLRQSGLINRLRGIKDPREERERLRFEMEQQRLTNQMSQQQAELGLAERRLGLQEEQLNREGELSGRRLDQEDLRLALQKQRLESAPTSEFTKFNQGFDSYMQQRNALIQEGRELERTGAAPETISQVQFKVQALDQFAQQQFNTASKKPSAMFSFKAEDGTTIRTDSVEALKAAKEQLGVGGQTEDPYNPLTLGIQSKEAELAKAISGGKQFFGDTIPLGEGQQEEISRIRRELEALRLERGVAPRTPQVASSAQTGQTQTPEEKLQQNKEVSVDDFFNSL